MLVEKKQAGEAPKQIFIYNGRTTDVLGEPPCKHSLANQAKNIPPAMAGTTERSLRFRPRPLLRRLAKTMSRGKTAS